MILRSLLLLTLHLHFSSTTKFVLLGSLGDLAKKYIWSALQDNLDNPVFIDVEIYGSSRSSPEEGERQLLEFLDTLPKADITLEDIQNKLDVTLENIQDKLDVTIEDIQDKLDITLKSLPGYKDKVIADGKALFEKVEGSIQDTTVEDAQKLILDKVDNFLSVGRSFFEKGKNTFSKLMPKAKAGATVKELFDDPKSASEKLVTLISSKIEIGKMKAAELTEKVEALVDSLKHSPLKNKVKYLQLKTEQHFEQFCTNFENELLIFYLSIPPSAYVSTTQSIAKHCKNNGNSVRVAYEKPLGYSHESSAALLASLTHLIGNQQIFLIDHYLGKSLTRQIPVVRQNHPELESKLTRDHVSSVEVTLLEKADCEGRAGYYDKSGVIRDMLQNHATELLTLLMAEMTSSEKGEAMTSSEEGEAMMSQSGAKADVVRSLSLPNQHQTVVAQYGGYSSHVGVTSSTPTFASVLFFSSLARWEGVPLLLTSGKSQKRDRKEIVVWFKNGDKFHLDYTTGTITYRGENLLAPDYTPLKNSYTSLLSAVVSRDKTLLPDPDSVLASWRIWDHVINLPANLLLHGDSMELKVERAGRFLVAGYTENPGEANHMMFFNKAFMVGDHEEHLYEHLARDLVRVVKETVVKRDVHIALSGGRSILGVYKYLVAETVRTGLDWGKVHVWQADERCEWGSRNAADLMLYLVDEIGSIKRDNVHLMPVAESGCGDVSLYQDMFNEFVSRGKFHYVILGLGKDGHTASLFPDAKIVEKSKDFVLIHSDSATPSARMSMNIGLINKSDWVSILVTGSGKKEIISKIRNGEEFPVSEVENSQLTWYLDEILI